ncbi:FtsX-like permease family protein [Actinomyces israelii]|uniref:FtsX-like permease family protein n=1 Tax=Actinomyces israelii TaxID=1659 RepID=UPI0005BA4A01|nr:FtsX-like permease family protein [Actinomyces israelii]
MTRYTLRALAAQWRAWSGTVVVLALAAVLVDVCLAHRMTVTRPDVVAAARDAGVSPRELAVPGVSMYFYSAMVAIPVVAVVGQSCVQALRTSWARWRLAGALPRQVLASVVATVAVLGAVACVPGILVGLAVDQPFAEVLTRMAAQRMGRIEVAQTPATAALTVVSVVGIAVIGAIGPARSAVRTPATEAVRTASPVPVRRRMGVVRWVLAGAWALVCAVQLLAALLVRPGKSIDGLPDGGGQAMLAALLLAVLVVLLAPALIPGLLRAWSAPLTRLGGPCMIARRSALWRSSLAASAIALLSLAFSFAAVLVTNLEVARAVIRAAHLHAVLSQTDSLVLASILGAMALLGAIAVVAMASRSRQREIAVLRCAGTTIGRVHAQVVIEAGLYVGTALIISIVPTAVTAVGEALFLARAGLPFLPRPAVGTLALVALASFAALTAVLLAPVRRAYRAPIGPTLAAE